MPYNNGKAEVLVAYTRPEIWKVVQRRMIANQDSIRRDADYIAFLRVRHTDDKGNYLPSAITHIAKVIKVEIIKVNPEYFEKNMPEATFLIEEKGWNSSTSYNKEYYLEWIRELKEPILHRHGERSRGQILFYTSLEEIKNRKYISDISLSKF